MIQTKILFILLILLCFIPPVEAQRPIDQDYFTANEFPNIKGLLQSVDTHHTSKAADWIFRGSMHYAIDELRYTLDTFPNHPKALQLIGVVSKIKKLPEIAIPFYEKALRLYPQYALTYAQYGGYLTDIGRVEEGIAKLQKAIEIDPNLALAFDSLSKAYTKIGNLELARQAAEKAKELGLKTGQ